MCKDELILVDGEDNVLGYLDKDSCHDGEGVLHRAFSIFIFNSRGELLIQKRSSSKRLWPLFWSNTCCSHPRKGESIENAAARRLVEECGIACVLRYVYNFQYEATFRNEGSENELCSVFVGFCDSDVVFSLDEVDDSKWILPSDLFMDVDLNPSKYTPWFRKEIIELKNKGFFNKCSQ